MNTTMNTIFPEQTIDRSVMRWEDYTYTLTPFEQHQGLWWKREDYFAPLGYGGPNGSKLRQLLFLTDQYVAKGGNAGLITGASVLSPQLSMSALVSKHYGLTPTLILGATKPETAIKHENVYIAAAAGAEFIYTPVGYNPALQRAVKQHSESERYKDHYRLCYGITTPEDATDDDIRAFHEVGAYQVKNLPPNLTTLGMTAGSCNSCVSVLYGIAKYRPADLERVILFGIGPTRLNFIEERLRRIENATGIAILDLFRRKYHHHRDLEAEHQTGGEILIEHYDLHHTKFSGYQDKMPFELRDKSISFHPTYEGKALTYMDRNRGMFEWYHEPDGKAAFWIVGGQPNREIVERAL